MLRTGSVTAARALTDDTPEAATVRHGSASDYVEQACLQTHLHSRGYSLWLLRNERFTANWRESGIARRATGKTGRSAETIARAVPQLVHSREAT